MVKHQRKSGESIAQERRRTAPSSKASSIAKARSHGQQGRTKRSTRSRGRN